MKLLVAGKPFQPGLIFLGKTTGLYHKNITIVNYT
jgi:hypothetical protein